MKPFFRKVAYHCSAIIRTSVSVSNNDVDIITEKLL